jgi:LAO/AO transport system kinase
MSSKKKIDSWISSRKKRLESFKAEELFPLLLAGDKNALSSAITLIESTHPSARHEANKLIDLCAAHPTSSWRIGITGVPGVGKSTFIEAFGAQILEAGHKLAVLAVDPSSNVSGGSILGDKTRMNTLSKEENAFIRPTAAAGNLGGVARCSRDAMLLCETAGFDIILIETVGVGQSETMVHGMVDYFLLLLLAGAGDELQGMKRGIMELADTILITKADSGNEKASQLAARSYANAVHLFPAKESDWITNVLTTSSLDNKGLSEAWENLKSFFNVTVSNGFFLKNRRVQNSRFLRENFAHLILNEIDSNETLKSYLNLLEQKLAEGTINPGQAVDLLFKKYKEFLLSQA